MSYQGKNKSKVHDSKTGYDIYADTYDEDIGYLNSFEKDVLVTILGDLTGKKVLDLGAGTGRLIRHLRNLGAKVVAADLSENMLKKLKDKYNDVETVCADAEDLPFEKESFDVVVSTFLIVHLKDLDTVFSEIYRILKPGGLAFITNINQKKAPKLVSKKGEKLVIKSFYHRPEDVIKNLENNFFFVEKNEFVNEGKIWVNQIIKVRKS